MIYFPLLAPDSVWPDWAYYWTLGNFLKTLATINLPKSPTFKGIFCSLSFFLVKSFLGNFKDIWRVFLVTLLLSPFHFIFSGPSVLLSIFLSLFLFYVVTTTQLLFIILSYTFCFFTFSLLLITISFYLHFLKNLPSHSLSYLLCRLLGYIKIFLSVSFFLTFPLTRITISFSQHFQCLFLSVLLSCFYPFLILLWDFRRDFVDTFPTTTANVIWSMLPWRSHLKKEGGRGETLKLDSRTTQAQAGTFLA